MLTPGSKALERKYRPIELGAPGEEISTKDLYAISQRFKNLNQFRLQNVQGFLQPRQRIFLNILPLAFHQNNPLLPGFVSTQTPFGIPDYVPNKESIQAAKHFSKSFKYTRKARLHYGIDSIFLMGSVGSIAFSKTSDMDIWLCHSPTLNKPETDELQAKAIELEKWANSLGLEVHFFLINSEQFKSGMKSPLSVESSGSTQHFLLLEEFYRTAIYIAGKFPAWWIIPPEYEENYSTYLNHLLQNRFISRHEIIDFGGLENVPADEFISATLWHLLKSLSSPYKSLLKLFLMECYASEYPHTQWLCTHLKASVFKGDIDIDKLDPYLLIYEKVETYLQLVSSKKQMLLARQCFYLKIMGDNPRALDAHMRSIRQQQLHQIATQWQWPDDLLDELNKQLFWNVQKACEAHSTIRNQLKLSLQTIVRFSQDYTQNDLRNNVELKLIARKFHAFMEHSPGKIEILTTRKNIFKKELELILSEINTAEDHTQWQLSLPDAYGRDHQRTAITTCNSLLELCCWIVANNLFTSHIKINVASKNCVLSQSDVHVLLNKLSRFFSSSQQQNDTLDHYLDANALTQSLFLINFNDAAVQEREDGTLLMSNRSDPLSYGLDKINLITSIEKVSMTSWDELITQRYSGLEGLLDCLVDTFNDSQQPLSTSQIHTLCFTPMRAKTIVSRIEQIIKDLIIYFQQNSPARYILPAENSYVVFEKNETRLEYIHIESDKNLLDILSLKQAGNIKTIFGDHVLPESPVPFIYSQSIPDQINIFFSSAEKGVQVFIIDETNALFSHFHNNSNAHQVISNYESFFNGLQKTAQIRLDTTITYFELVKSQNGLFSCYPYAQTKIPPDPQLSIRILATPSDNKENLTIFCNESEYSSTHNADLFAQVQQHISNYRKNQDDYPIYINEIDVPPLLLGVDNKQDVYTVCYLRYKQKIEQLLSI